MRFIIWVVLVISLVETAKNPKQAKKLHLARLNSHAITAYDLVHVAYHMYTELVEGALTKWLPSQQDLDKFAGKEQKPMMQHERTRGSPVKSPETRYYKTHLDMCINCFKYFITHAVARS